MHPVPFDREKHLAQVEAWCVERDKSVFPVGWLPKTGRIVEGVLAAWLYKSDSELCWIENVLSNPATTHEQRQVALDEVTESLLDEARACGFRFVLGFSSIPTVIEAAKRHGFQVSKHPYFTLVRDCHE